MLLGVGEFPLLGHVLLQGLDAVLVGVDRVGERLDLLLDLAHRGDEVTNVFVHRP